MPCRGAGGLGAGQPACRAGSGGGRDTRGGLRGAGNGATAPSVALSLHRRRTLLPVLSKPTFPFCCPSQTFKSRESGPK